MANGHGGARAGAGRKSTRHEFVPVDGVVTPLEFILAVMADATQLPAVRMDAAKAALPYCSARLQNTILDVEGDLSIQLVSYLDADPNP